MRRRLRVKKYDIAAVIVFRTIVPQVAQNEFQKWSVMKRGRLAVGLALPQKTQMLGRSAIWLATPENPQQTHARNPVRGVVDSLWRHSLEHGNGEGGG